MNLTAEQQQKIQELKHQQRITKSDKRRKELADEIIKVIKKG